MATYEVTNQLLFWQATPDYADTIRYPQMAPVAEILTDGSFFIASTFEGPWYPPGRYNGSGIRMWHLSASLEIIGSPVDLGPFLNLAGHSGGSECWPVGMAVADNHVLMSSVGEFFSDDHYHANQYSWIIDCSGDSPVVKTTHMFYNDGTQVGQYDSMENSCLYDAATNRAFIGSYGGGGTSHVAVEVFNATTGERLSVGQGTGWYTGPYTGGNGCIGLYMDPKDSTKFAAIEPYARMNWPPLAGTLDGRGYTVQFSFTIPLDGSSVTGTGARVCLREPTLYGGGWIMAAGSPYIPGGPGIISTDSIEKHVVYWGTDGNAVLSGDYPNVFFYQDNLSTDGDRNLIALFEHDTPTWSNPYGVLFIVDQTTKTLETLDLPFFGLPGPQEADNPQMVLSADPTGTRLLVAANVNDPRYNTYSLLLWVVDRGRPNLVGNLLDDRVRFWGK